MNVGGKRQRLRVVRLQGERALELSQSQLVLPRSVVVINAERDVGFRQIGGEGQSLLRHSPDLD